MFITMNGKVKMDIAKTTVGRPYSSAVFARPERLQDRVNGPFRQEDELEAEGDVQGPKSGKTMKAPDDPSAVAHLAHEDVGAERQPEGTDAMTAKVARAVWSPSRSGGSPTLAA